MINKEIKNGVMQHKRYSLFFIISTSLAMLRSYVTVDDLLSILVLLFSGGSHLVKLLVRVFHRATEKKINFRVGEKVKSIQKSKTYMSCRF